MSNGDDKSLCLEELARTGGRWLSGEGPESDIVVSTRIRLARNLVGYPFMSCADDEIRQQLVDSLRKTISTTEVGRDFQFIDVAALDEMDTQLLVERQLISRELAQSEGPRGVIIGNGERVSIMLNEEDHVRMQLLGSGFSLQQCWEQINELDDALEDRASFAFDESLGYLTACPTNVGTGIRISVMLHLPGLRITGEIQKVHQAAQKINLAVRGLYGEGSQAMGDFYQISNQVTLGCSEQHLLDNLTEVVPNILGYERRVRDLLCRDNRANLDDQISRAMGILTSARTISSTETMRLLSLVRLGINLGMISDVSISVANELFLHTQPSHLQKLSGGPLKTPERNEARATHIREKLQVP
ncbi:MAG: protein arginine kinase [Fuerstiella sp.]|jgi:protein arginine kinase|nr:protein arginine kinase [Fuerstiella sp.]MCP4507602.1 protein arginine kinase [Fuerstiella sp.]MDG2128043.1 protein arginine kinase [Fuerstiella sp.]